MAPLRLLTLAGARSTRSLQHGASSSYRPQALTSQLLANGGGGGAPSVAVAARPTVAVLPLLVVPRRTFAANTTSTAKGAFPDRGPARHPLSPRRTYAADATSTAKGALPDRGPAREKLRAVPFEATRAEADAAFAQYHNRHFLQARQAPALRRGAKESFLPFWIVPPGGCLVRTRLTRASLGVDRLVSRYDARTGKREPRWETQWTDVALDYDSTAAVVEDWEGDGGKMAAAAAALGVDHAYSPGDPRLQLYAGSPKYGRADARKVGPAQAVSRARAITPEMLKVSEGGGAASTTTTNESDDCRRVGPFVMPPDVARRLAQRQVEALEAERCEAVVRALAPRALRQGGGAMAMHVRLLDLRVEFLSDHGGGPEVAPVYAPVFVFSWRHAGVKVRTMVSGVRGGGAGAGAGAAGQLRVAGPILPDETKVAVLTTAAVLLGLQATGAAAAMSGTALFYGGFVLPFIGSGLAARVWPAARTLADRGGERAADAAAGLAGAGAQAAKGLFGRVADAAERFLGLRLPSFFGGRGGDGGGGASYSSSSSSSSSTFDAEYVRAYEQAETFRSRRAAEEERRRARAGQDYGGGAAYGGQQGDDDEPFTFTSDDFAEAVRNPFAWAERKAAEMARRQARRRAREQARRDQYERRYGGGGGGGGQRYQQQQQQQRASSPPPPGSGPRDPQGFYHLLGVSPDATTAEIQAAFRGRAMRDHPDRVPQGAPESERQEATRRFQRLSAAYNCLRDPRRRRDYDAGGWRGGGGGSA